MLSSPGMADKATRVDILCGSLFEDEELRGICWVRDVGSRSTVASLAALVRRPFLRVLRCLPVRRLLPGCVLSCVAGLASLRTGIIGSRIRFVRGSFFLGHRPVRIGIRRRFRRQRQSQCRQQRQTKKQWRHSAGHGKRHRTFPQTARRSEFSSKLRKCYYRRGVFSVINVTWHCDERHMIQNYRSGRGKCRT